ncbi:MAG: hypothetical protein DI577_06465 [Microbacterium sp.]|nr:MAG: hypothetical protein DI577_06465 [Microbacterium sp.]PZU35822.1 MAG: hypothetical protein DI575_06465 [Microbacterium sp.]
MRVVIGSMLVPAGEAGGAAGDHERSHGDAIPGEFDRQMRDVGGHEGGGSPRLDDPVGDEDERATRVGLLQRPTCRPRRLDARRPPRAGERFGLGEADVRRHLHVHGDRLRGCGRQRARDVRDECRGIRCRCSERRRERPQHRIGDAAGERIEQPLLPRCDLVDHDGAVSPELHGGFGAPQRRAGGGESQHAPILLASPHRRSDCPQATRG